MSPIKLAVLGGLLSCALTACGAAVKPIAGTGIPTPKPIGRGVVDDPRTTHWTCMLKAGIQVRRVGATELQVDPPGIGPTVTFEPTAGSAQQAQIGGTVQGAEAIGTALLYPNQGSDSQLKKIEDCLATGVQG